MKVQCKETVPFETNKLTLGNVQRGLYRVDEIDDHRIIFKYTNDHIFTLGEEGKLFLNIDGEAWLKKPVKKISGTITLQFD